MGYNIQCMIMQTRRCISACLRQEESTVEDKKLISVIVPCYNEEEVLPLFYKEITKTTVQMQKKYPELEFEYLFIDDGSKDRTLSALRIMAKHDARVRYVSFSRNFGKESGMYAGLKESRGDYCVVMDADLQHPPAFLPQMYEAVKDGRFDCATTRRVSREGESKVRSWFAHRFYGIMNRISQTEIVDGAQDFRFMTRQMVDAVLSMTEYNRFSKGIFSWVGFRTKYLEYKNVERAAGKTSWSFWGLFRYSIEGMLGFSTAPLTATAGVGLVMFLLGIIMLIFTVLKKLIVGDPVAGYATTICTILLFGGLQLFCTGILGLYMGKTFLEVKHRPIYIIRETEKNADQFPDPEEPEEPAKPAKKQSAAAVSEDDDDYDDDEYDEYDDDEYDDDYDDDEYEDDEEDYEDEAPAPVKKPEPEKPAVKAVPVTARKTAAPKKESALDRALRLKEESDAEFDALVDAAFEEADAKKADAKKAAAAAAPKKETPVPAPAPAKAEEKPAAKKEKFVVEINYDNDDLYDDFDDEDDYDDDYEDDYEDDVKTAPARKPAVKKAAASAKRSAEDQESFGEKVKGFFGTIGSKLKGLTEKLSGNTSDAAGKKKLIDGIPAEEYDDYDDDFDDYDDDDYDDYDDYDDDYDDYDDDYDDDDDDDYDDDDYDDDDDDYDDDEDYDDDYDDDDYDDDPKGGRNGYRSSRH